jgi:dynein heavy chain, axonemal
VCLLLTGALHGTRNYISHYLSEFQRFDWLWKDDKEAQYRRFLDRHHDNPTLDAFEAELIK